ncbi:MAG: GNAT family N-acetyltransferase [Gammaproteobacteria bacterium]|nr:GNAT family N-acetyltransferase [Gammaproteobacteria bacterium]
MKIEEATRESLQEISELIKQSIVTLCQADHQNKPEHLQAWLSARASDKLAHELFGNNSRAFTCRHEGRLAGVVNINTTGEMTLCYVHPAYSGRGVGRLLLQAAEEQAIKWGLKQIHLVSTRTAREFYLSQGFESNGEEICHIGMPGYPLLKVIQT